MELRQLRYFLAAYDTGSISSAAKACRIAQPSVSQAILNLEAELGASLFVRTRRGLQPTEPAHVFATSSRRLLADAAAMKTAATARTQTQVTLRLYLHPTLAARRVARFAAQMTAASEMDLRVVETIEEAEIVVGPRMDDGPGVDLWTEQYLLCLPRTDPLAVKDRIHLSDLTGLRLIARCSCERPTALPIGVVKPEIVAVAADEDRVLALVAAGIGAAIIPGAPDNHPDVAVRRVEDFSLRRTISARARGETREVVQTQLAAAALACRDWGSSI